MEIFTSTETIVSVSDMSVFSSEGSLEIKCAIPLKFHQPVLQFAIVFLGVI